PLHRYLAQLQIGGTERRILGVLARNSPLPLQALNRFADGRGDAIQALMNLIDASLVRPEIGTPWYYASEPIVDYIDREYPACSVDDYKAIADELEKLLEGDEYASGYLELSRVFYRALIHAGREQHKLAYSLLADWLRLAEEFYNGRDY